MDKLVTMTEFISLAYRSWAFEPVTNAAANYMARTRRYASLLTCPLELGFFLPTDDEGNILDHPERMNFSDTTEGHWAKEDYTRYYHHALDNILFDGDFRIREETKPRKDKMKFLYCYFKGDIHHEIGYFFENKHNSKLTIEDVIRQNYTLTARFKEIIYGDIKK